MDDIIFHGLSEQEIQFAERVYAQARGQLTQNVFRTEDLSHIYVVVTKNGERIEFSWISKNKELSERSSYEAAGIS